MLDISSRGFLLQANQPPGPGMYIELCRGRASVVARVVWARNQRFGVRTRERVAIEAFMGSFDCGAATRIAAPDASAALPERRHRTRDEAHERSRQLGRMMEQGAVLAAGLAGVALLAIFVTEALGRPLAVVVTALG